MSETVITFRAPKLKKESKPGCTGCGCGCWSLFLFFFLLGLAGKLVYVKDFPATAFIAIGLAWYVHRWIMSKLGHSQKTTTLKSSNNEDVDNYQESDDFGDFRSEFVQLPYSDIVEFSYQDNSGDVTKRRVEVQAIRKKYHFSGFCLLRNAPRTFKFANIKGKIVRVSTGEVLAKNDWLIELQEMTEG